MGEILGCDIGNGYAYTSVLLDYNGDPIPLLPPDIANIGMPTAAYVIPPECRDIEVYTNNRPAESRHRNDPDHLVRAIKNRLSEGSIRLTEKDPVIQTETIYNAVVRDLLLLTQQSLNNENIYDIVFTFPAALRNDTVMLDRMQRSIERIQINGNHMNVRGRLPEPAAVAIDYLYYMQHIAPEDIRINDEEYTVLVYDLGYGTFDAAVVTAYSKGNPYTLHYVDGLKEVGGKDFDKVLYDEILAILSEKYEYSPRISRQKEEVLRQAVSLKMQLSTPPYLGEVSLPVGDETVDVEITRERFEQLSEYLMNQTLVVVQDLIERAERDGIKINAIVVSGGAGKMPMVEKCLNEFDYPVLLHRPSQAVSFGAARFAKGIAQGILSTDDNETEKTPQPNPSPNPVISQLTDFCYGIRIPSSEKAEGEVKFLLPCNSARPARSEPFSVSSRSSRMEIRVYRSRVPNRNFEYADTEDCDSVFFFHFDVNSGERYKVVIEAAENYDIRVILSSASGEEYIHSTSDEL